MVSVFDVAKFILDARGSMTTMKLQKLVYYCQAWSLVWDDKPLFSEEIQAWANGPVVYDLYLAHKGKYMVSAADLPQGNPALLDDEQKATINSVLEYYGDKKAGWLIELTHLEDPWKNTRAGVPIGQRSDRVISHSEMAEYYSGLIE